MGEIGNVAKLTKLMLALFAGITLVTSTFTILESSQLTNQIDVSVKMKQTKKLSLIAIKNNEDVPIFGLKLKMTDGNIKFAKARGWDGHRIDNSTVTMNTQDNPLLLGRPMIVLLLSGNPNSPVEWSLLDKDGNLLANGVLQAKFLTKEDAIKIVKTQYFANRNMENIGVQTEFAFLKYNSTQNDAPQFIWYRADPNSKAIGEKIGSVVFDKFHGKYLSDKQIDRFVWIVTYVEAVPTNSEFFVDAQSGEVIGMWNPCPMCICLSGDTLIDTPNGPMNIKKLKDGMSVWTLDNLGHKQPAIILKTGKTLVPSMHMMIHIVLDDGRELFASARHPTADGRLLGDLTKGDILDNSHVKSMEHVPYNETYTYDILPSGSTGFYWANGILVGSTLK